MVVFFLRREPLYHKLQYSKCPKFDAAAATFGVTVGAFGAYLALSSLGSMGADLADLTVFCWYVAVWLGVGSQLLGLARSGAPRAGQCRLGWVALIAELGCGLAVAARRSFGRHSALRFDVPTI